MPENRVRTGRALIRQVDETKVPFGMLAIWFLGQCSVIIKGADTVLYIDPYLSPSPHRTFDPPLKPEELTNAQVVLITHEHLDHLDSDTITRLASVKDDTVYMAPACCRDELLRCKVPLDKLHAARTNEWWTGPGFRVKPIPSAHEELEYDAEMNHRYVGYIVDVNGVTLYHAGDTTVYPGLIAALKEESIDLGLLPINGRDSFRNARNLVGNMNYREAVELAVAVQFAVQDMVQKIVGQFGRIDMLFNNAGISGVGAVHEVELDAWDRVVNVNIRGMFLPCKYVIPHMMERRGGTIINMSSCVAEIGLARRASYAATKGAVLALTKSMQVDYAAYDIRVNALLPGTIMTPFVENYLKSSYDNPEEAIEGIKKRQLSGELGRPEDVVKAALFLASDESKFMMGSPMYIDGGATFGKNA